MMDIANLLLSYSSTKKTSKEIYPSRVYTLLKELQYNPNKMEYIHITGSKGKGSLACTSFELLKGMGYRVGLFTSPHIFDVRERFITNDGMIFKNTLLNLIERFDSFFKEQQLHFFEICLFLALVYFEEENCEYVVLEVGVGGRYDPTNFCKPLVSLLGQVSLEHKEFLGNTIEEIAFDKAGIIKENVPAFSIDQDRIVESIFLEQGKVQFYKDLCLIEDLKIFDEYYSLFHLNIYGTKKDVIYNIKLCRIGMANVQNFCLAVVAIMDQFPHISYDVIREVAEKKIPYRIDVICPNILIDTAHNGSSFNNLLQSLDSWLHWKEITLYLTILKGKELDDIVEILIHYKYIIRKIIVFDFDTNGVKESNGKELTQLLTNHFNIHYVSDLYKEGINKTPLEKIVFAGSFYSIPMITKILRNQNLCN